jgi:hypothetical protein
MAPSGIAVPAFIATDRDQAIEATDRLFGTEGSINPVFR